MRQRASILHLDLDAFFASVEQRDKPSLQGRPVIVGGLGQRGVVATASYEARTYGVHSAMPMHEARRRCPQGNFLAGRFRVYRQASRIVMDILEDISPLVEPLSMDEAFVDLAASAHPIDFEPAALRSFAEEVRARVRAETGGLRASIGLGTSKFIAKVASEVAKPDGVHLVVPGTEVATIAPMSVRAIPGVGPATFDRLARLGVGTVADLQQASEHELVRELGRSAGTGLYALAHARDDRPVTAEREAKSISVEDTFDTDLVTREQMSERVTHDAALVAARVRSAGVFARTVTLKVRLHDFTTWTRSRTLEGATDSAEVIAAEALDMLAGVQLDQGVRLLGVGVAGLVGVAQDRLFELREDHETLTLPTVVEEGPAMDPATDPAWQRRPPRWLPGADVVHDEWGPGWIWGSGLGRVTVRFETAETGVGPVRTFALDDPALHLVIG